MMRSWKLGQFFGIGVYVHWSFLLVPLLVLFNNLQMGTLALAPYALTLVLAVFGCVVLHEFGHALAARRFGIGTRDITVLPIGGIARLERMSERPWEEFWIAVAGPAVNVVIAALLLPLAGGIPVDKSGTLVFPSGHFLFDLAVYNLVLVAFNMLPAFPSDGGRVLRALLATRLGRLRATEIAAWVGMVVAGGIGLLGLYASEITPVFVAAFLIFAGQQELAFVRHKESLRQEGPLTVVPADPVLRELPLEPRTVGFTGLLWNAQLGAWVLWQNGRPVSVVS